MEDLRILYEDDDVLVIDKPPGLLSATPPESKEISAFRLMKQHARKGRGPTSAWIIHRLDREASGLMVFAKSETAFSWLKEDFRARRVERRYLAVIDGEMRSPDGKLPEGTVQSFLREDRFGRVFSLQADRTESGTPRPEDDHARFAVTHYRAVAIARGRTLVELRMESGRKHQIRVHMSDLGHPIAGDWRYGSTTNVLGRLGLHSVSLGFRHPATGEMMQFECPPPASFHECVGMHPPRTRDSVPAVPSLTRRPPPRTDRLDTSWDAVADWYTKLVDGERSDHLDQIIVPGALRLLEPLPGQRVLDIACGEGVFCRRLAQMGVQPIGLDASPRLIQLAQAQNPTAIRYEVADARDLTSLALPTCDAAVCLMALMNIDPLAPLFDGLAQHLTPGGRFVAVLLHPAFRAPRQTSWGSDREGSRFRKFRRVDGYLSSGQFEIVMNPGDVAAGRPKVTTWTFHRPLQTYVRLLAERGFVIDAIEEWPSLRTSPGSPTAAEENRVRREIPLFLGLRARKAAAT